MATYNYVSNNPAVSTLVNNQIYTVLFETINEGPATLYFTPANTPVLPILTPQLQFLTGTELDGAMQLAYVEAENAFILIGASPVVPVNSITGAKIVGANAVNLIQDPLFQYGNIYWNFNNSENIVVTPNLAPGGVTGLTYTGAGISVDQYVVSTYISVVDNTNYVLQGYIDATQVTSSIPDYPAWLVQSTDLSTTYASAIQTSGVAGVVVAPTFQFPSDVSEVVVVFSTNNATIAAGELLVASSPLLQIGTGQPIYTTSYVQQSGSTGLTGIFGSQTYSILNPPTDSPSTVTGTLSTNYSGGATSITIDGLTAGQVLSAGTDLIITGDGTVYTTTALATANGSGVITVTLTTGLVNSSYSSGTDVTIYPPNTPSTAPGGSISFINGGSGSDSWTSTAYSGNNGLQIQVTGGGILITNTELGISYIVTGNEIFSFYYLVVSNAPDFIAIKLSTNTHVPTTTWVYWGSIAGYSDLTASDFVPVGPLPSSSEVWNQVVFTASQLKLGIGADVDGVSWAMGYHAGTSTVIFSNFGSNTVNTNPNFSIQTESVGIDAITTPAESILTTPIMAGGTSAELEWDAGSTTYVPGSLVLDSNNNGELCTSAIQIDLTGQLSPATCFAHFIWTESSIPTPTGTGTGLNARIGATQNAGTNILAIAPLTAGVPADVVGVQQNAPPSAATSVVLPSGNPTPGNTLLACIALNSFETVTAPSGWTQQITTTAAPTVVTFSKVAGASEPSSYTFTWGSSTDVSAALFELFGAGAINTTGESRSASVSSIYVPSITPTTAYCMCFCFYAFATTGTGNVTTVPSAIAGSSTPSWSGSIGGVTQDQTLVWENIGPNAPYDQWVTIALPVSLPINNITDFVDMFVTDTEYTTSNMALGDSIEIQFIDQNNVIIAQGLASVVAFSTSGTPTSAQSSSQGSGILIHKKSSGVLSGESTITAQVRARNGSGNGTFAFALVQADVEIQDNMK